MCHSDEGRMPRFFCELSGYRGGYCSQHPAFIRTRRLFEASVSRLAALRLLMGWRPRQNSENFCC